MAEGDGDGGGLGGDDGVGEGLVLGQNEGAGVGRRVGTDAGIADGDEVGLWLGLVVGVAEGLELGADDGLPEGVVVGSPEGVAVVGGSVGAGVWETKNSTEFATVPSPSHAIVSVYASSIAEDDSKTEFAPSFGVVSVPMRFPFMSSTLTSTSAQALESPR